MNTITFPVFSAAFAPLRLGVQSIGVGLLKQFAIALVAALLFASIALADPVAPAGAAATAAKPTANAATSDWPAMLFVFMLATFIGLGVITRVSRLLHTPLMSLTNAISAIAVVAAIAMAGSDHALPITILGAIALFASTTNIVSGFLITDRMLKMFKRQEPK
jgi:NAD(P) transhydrogenase subunit alpha